MVEPRTTADREGGPGGMRRRELLWCVCANEQSRAGLQGVHRNVELGPEMVGGGTENCNSPLTTADTGVQWGGGERNITG